MAVERVLSNLNLISFKTEGGLQNHIDELQDGDLVFTPDNSLKGNLFDFKWTDHKLNDISWLNADTFSWQSGDVYVAAFEHLVNDYMSLSGKGVLYAWTNTAGDETYYTKTSTPSVGDQLFDETGTPAIVSNSYVNGEISVVFVYADGSITYARTDPNAMLSRDTSKDVALSTPASETETVDDITITFYRAEDGHKICLADQEANVQRLYDWMGVAWYYILDTENKQFKLPRTKYAFTGLRDSVGGYVKAGLPNISGGIYNIIGNSPSADGAFNVASSWVHDLNAAASGAVESGTNYNFNASKSNSIYGNSDTVQPPATQMYLYFYVGNFEREAVEQTAGINAEMFDGKADINLGNTPFSLLGNNNGTLTWNGVNMSAMGMPSTDKFIDLTLGATGSSYSAPADGWVYFSKVANGSTQYVQLNNNKMRVISFIGQSGQDSAVIIPVKKGDTFMASYTAGGTTRGFRFIYAEGAKHLA